MCSDWSGERYRDVKVTSVGQQTTGCPLYCYWQHLGFIIQYSIFVWLPTTADSGSSATFETTRVVMEAVINSQQLSTVFLALCLKRLQTISLHPWCISRINATCRSCVLRSERILAPFIGGRASSLCSGHGGSVKLHCTAYWASYLTFVFWSIKHKWRTQSPGIRWAAALPETSEVRSDLVDNNT